MRSLETIMRENPDATVKEVFAMQEQDKIQDEKEYQERNSKVIAFITDLNENGGYYRGRFGFDQHYYYRVFDLTMESTGEVRMNVEKLIMFYNSENKSHTTIKPGEIKIERDIETYQKLDQYGLDDRERVTVKEWDEVNAYLDAISEMFWMKLPK